MHALPLFTQYPQLEQSLPYTSIGSFPTPLTSLHALAKTLKLSHLYFKNDGVSARDYGGSKVRKLEFILGDAINKGAKEVLTFGYAGSNHVTATALHGRAQGIHTIALLLPQPNAFYVRHNLLIQQASQAGLHYYANPAQLVLSLPMILLQHKFRTGAFPLIIPPGGSSPLGIIGFVNAAVELCQQLATHEQGAPDKIYVATGSMGTAIGLLLGLQVTGLHSQLVAVSVLPGSYVNYARMRRMYQRANRYLHHKAPAFRIYPFPKDQVEIRQEFVGSGYAQFTQGGSEAMEMMQGNEGITLEGSYTAKALAALIQDARAGVLEGKTALFWNTCNTQAVDQLIEGVDFHQLPTGLHHYFESPVQPLDSSHE